MRISVIIPTYNCADFLTEAIRSVLSQSYAVHELIVVDDGSTDDTATLVRQFRKDVTYIRTGNHGVAAARNTGLATAKGDCVAFLDADDAWYPRKLELQVRVFEAHPQIHAVCSDFSLVDQHGNVIQEQYVKGKYRVFRAYALDWPDMFPDHESLTDRGKLIEVYYGDAFRALFLGNFVNTSSLLLKREAIDQTGRFTIDRHTQEDYEFWLKVALHGPIAYMDLPLLLFRRRPNQLTSDARKLRMAQDVVDVTRALAESARHRLGDQVVAQRLSDTNCTLAMAYLGKGQATLARRALAQAYMHVGLEPRIAFFYAWSWLPVRIGDGIRRAHRWLRRRGGNPA